jgi:PEP-CTERM motif
MSRPIGCPAALFAFVLLLAGPVSVVSAVFDVDGTTMRMFNQVCGPCTAAVTGTLTLDDDGAGNVVLTDLSLAHAGYQIGSPTLLSIVVERSSIVLGAGSVAGTGSTLTSVVFGSTTITQTGSVTCTAVTLGCDFVGLPAGATPFDQSPLAVDLGKWSFDAAGGLSARFTYMAVTSPPAIEYLYLVGTPVPEPGSGVLLAIGVIALGSRRRN